MGSDSAFGEPYYGDALRQDNEQKWSALAAARREAEEALAEYDRLWGAAHATNAYGRAVVGLASALRALLALLAAGPEAKTPVTTPVPWLECLTVISNPIVPQGAILIHPDTLAGKPDALAYRPPDPLPQPAPITPPPPGDAVREAAERLRQAVHEYNDGCRVGDPYTMDCAVRLLAALRGGQKGGE